MHRTYSATLQLRVCDMVSKFKKKNKNKMKLLQNKYICFCLQRDNREHNRTEYFDKIKWFPIDQRFKQCLKQ